jgi:hypothetical protein
MTGKTNRVLCVWTICIYLGLSQPNPLHGQSPLSVCINEDNFLVLRADTVVGTRAITAINFLSMGEHLIPAPGGLDASPDPFQFLLSNSPGEFSVGNLSLQGGVVIDELALQVGYDRGAQSVFDIASDLRLTWVPIHGEPVPGEIAEGVFCSPTSGDFNSDAVVDLADVDLLGEAIAHLDPDSSFDLNGDDQINQRDLEFFLSGNFITDGNKLLGDADFDGRVGFPDFLVLQSHFGEDGKKWSDGDFVANGRVEFSDFLVVSKNFGEVSDSLALSSAQSVPEPSGLLLIALGMVHMYTYRRGRNF